MVAPGSAAVPVPTAAPRAAAPPSPAAPPPRRIVAPPPRAAVPPSLPPAAPETVADVLAGDAPPGQPEPVATAAEAEYPVGYRFDATGTLLPPAIDSLTGQFVCVSNWLVRGNDSTKTRPTDPQCLMCPVETECRLMALQRREDEELARP